MDKNNRNALAYAGLIALVGRPNVGKSTLLNRLVGAKLSITSKRPQTTRHRILGIRTDPDAQYVFVDTPGFRVEKSSSLSDRIIRESIKTTLSQVNAICLIVEAKRLTHIDTQMVKLLPENQPVILILNKIDRLKDKERLLPCIARLSKIFNWTGIVPISSKNGTQVNSLLYEIRNVLPRQGLLYNSKTLTDRDECFLASEYIREKLFRLLGNELPYVAKVQIEKFNFETGLRHISASIIVNRVSIKPIIIGKNGETIKRIASQAREDMIRIFHSRVYLEVWVKVKSD